MIRSVFSNWDFIIFENLLLTILVVICVICWLLVAGSDEILFFRFLS